jgi:prepilin signal peptidase PulO-like enzyme (type II secretory pathway)
MTESTAWFLLITGIYVLMALTLVFLSAVDARLKLIPNQSNVLIGVMGVLGIATALFFNLPDTSFLAHYGLLFGFQDHLVLRHLVGALFGIGFFGAIVLFSRGRGMGIGDVKLAGVLGLFFGWPDVALISFIAFILGSIFGILVLIRGTKTMKSAVPFGPFIAVAAIAVFFWGEVFMRWYFTLFP